jgi:hypothetical protein
MLELLKEFWLFLKERKKFWLVRILIALVFVGFLLVWGPGAALAPFIHTLF